MGLVDLMDLEGLEDRRDLGRLLLDRARTSLPT